VVPAIFLPEILGDGYGVFDPLEFDVLDRLALPLPPTKSPNSVPNQMSFQISWVSLISFHRGCERSLSSAILIAHMAQCRARRPSSASVV